MIHLWDIKAYKDVNHYYVSTISLSKYIVFPFAYKYKFKV